MLKRAICCPALACLGVALIAGPALADTAKVVVHVMKDGAHVRGTTVQVTGETQTASEPQSVNPAIFAVEAGKLEFTLTNEDFPAGISTSVTVPGQGFFRVDLVIKGDQLIGQLDQSTGTLQGAIRSGTQAQMPPPYRTNTDRLPAISRNYGPQPIGGSGQTAGGGCGDTTLTQNTDPNTILGGNSVSCNAGGSNTDNYYARVFTAAQIGGVAGEQINCVDLGIETVVLTDVSGTLNLYGSLNGAPPITPGSGDASHPFLGSFPFNIPLGTELTTVTIDTSGAGILVPASGGLVVELFTPDNQATGAGVFVGSNNAGQSGPTFLAAADCGVPAYLDVGAIGFPGMHWVVRVDVGQVVIVDGACCDTSTGICTQTTNVDCEGEFTEGGDCAVVPCEILSPGDTCGDCVAGGPGDILGTTCDNTSSIPGTATTCAGSFDDIDEWVCYTATCNGTATVSTCNQADYDTALAVFDSCGGAQLACNDDGPGCGLTSETSFPIVGGTEYYVRVSGFGGQCGNYTLTISEECVGGPCGPGAGPCDIPNGTPGCDDEACCNSVCALDPFCCDVEWDQICADEAAADPNCQGGGGPCGPGSGPCNIPNGTPGCDDVACCESVCALDPFCCDVEWDQICADEAAADPNCQGGGGPCGPGSGPCDIPNGTPGCDDVDCCNAVCAVDPFCCDVEWDQICADGAAAICIDPGNDICMDVPANCQDFDTVNASNSTAGLFHAADNFSPAMSGSITDLCWWGVYIPGVQPDAFQVTYYANAGDIPGAVIGGPFTQGVDLTVQGPENTGQVVAGFPIWEYTGTHAPVAVDAGGCYWIEIINAPQAGGSWFWEWSLPGEGDATIVQDGTPPNGYDAGDINTDNGTDLSFCIGMQLGDPGAACDEPTGGCCVLGACSVVTEAECDAQGGIYNGDGTNCDETSPGMTYTSNPGLAIPDADATGVSDTINVPDAGAIFDLDVSVNIPHTWVGDLCVTLEHLGTTVTLIQRAGDVGGLGCNAVGCCGDSCDNLITEFDDEGAAAANDYCDVAAAVYIPEEALSAWDGMEMAGDWTIFVNDNAGGDLGTLASWSLNFNLPGVPPCDPVGACCGCPDENACQVLTEAACDAIPDAAYLGDGTNCDLPPGDTTVINAAGLGLAIPDSPGCVSHDLNMGMDFTVVDVDLALDISHTWVGDLCVTVSHGATSVVAVQRIGDPALGCAGGCCGCSDNNILATLDDGAGGSINDSCGSQAAGLDWTPSNPLSAFNGASSQGTWTIEICDNAGGDTGTLNGWALALTAPSNDPGPCVGECAVCGNGIVEVGEDCDDGNVADGDCCSSVCLWEASGSACGDGPTDCSGQDTCDGMGNCQVNHDAAGSPCGNPADTECTDPDTCNGNGTCLANHAPSGTPCGNPADLENCFTGDACTGGGVCQPGTIITECIDDDGCCNRVAGCSFENDNDCEEDVPTVSEWGLVILALLLAVAAKVYYGRRTHLA